MANERDRQPTSWGTSRPGPLESDDLIEGAPGTEGRAERQGGIRSDDMLDASRGTMDEDLAAQTLGLEENDDLDVGVDEYTDLDFDDNDLLDSEDLVSEGGALDHDETRNVYASGETGAGASMDDDENLGPDQRQPDSMALDRSSPSNDFDQPRKGSAHVDEGTTYSTTHARTTAASEDDVLPGEDTLDSFREHEPVRGFHTGADEGATQAAGTDDTEFADETDDKS